MRGCGKNKSVIDIQILPIHPAFKVVKDFLEFFSRVVKLF